MKKVIWYTTAIALIASCLFLANCATIVRGSSQKIPISSTPAGASIFVNGQTMGETPATLKLKRSNTYQIVVKKEGYKDITLNVGKEFKFVPTIIGNIFSFSLLGIIVDFVTGSAYQLTPEELQTVLEKKGISYNLPSNNKNEIHIVLIDKEDLK